MNEKIKVFIAGLVIGVIFGIVATRLYYRGYRGSPGESAELNRRIDQLSGELAERDRQIGDIQRGIQDGVAELIGYVDDAGIIIKRANSSATGIISNLREASNLIKQGIEERKNLEMELDNIRSGVYGIGNLARPYHKQIKEESEENE